MKMNSSSLIEDLIQRTQKNMNDIIPLLDLAAANLNTKADVSTWSALECIEHLNYYGNFYLPEIRRRMQEAKPVAEDQVFRSGWLGNYFAKSMLPKADLNKMKTFKSMNPAGSQLNKEVLSTFIAQQKEMLDLLQLARKVDLSKTKTSISISNWIRLRLGDTLRVVIYHNQRHVVQALACLQHQPQPVIS